MIWHREHGGDELAASCRVRHRDVAGERVARSAVRRAGVRPAPRFRLPLTCLAVVVLHNLARAHA